MALLFKIPDPLEKRINPKFLITRAGIQVLKGVAANAFIPDSLTEEPIGRSYLNTPVVDNLEFPQGAYTDLEDNEIEYGAIVIDTVLFEINRTRRIVETPVQGRDTVIKEYISGNDYQIDCRGILSNRDNVLPRDQARDLNNIFNIPQQVPLVSIFLNDIFEIFNIVIKSYRISQAEGNQNEIPFQFTAVSDVPIDLEELQ